MIWWSFIYTCTVLCSHNETIICWFLEYTFDDNGMSFFRKFAPCLSTDSKVKNIVKIKNRQNQAPHLTQDTIGESDKSAKKKTSHTRKPWCQPFPSMSPQGCKEQTRQQNIDKNKDKHEPLITKRIHKRYTALERSVKQLLEGLNMFFDVQYHNDKWNKMYWIVS